MAKLVDAPGLGPDASNGVGVRVPLLAPDNPFQINKLEIYSCHYFGYFGAVLAWQWQHNDGIGDSAALTAERGIPRVIRRQLQPRIRKEHSPTAYRSSRAVVNS